jgi:DNA-binding MarR family transcriptional regulator
MKKSRKSSGTIEPALPLDHPARKRLPPLLRKAWYQLNQAFRRRIADHDVTPDQFSLLRLLTEMPAAGVMQCELAEALTSDPNTVAALVSRMESSQLLVRSKHEKDRRAHRVKLTMAGRRKYARLRSIAVELQTEILEALPPERRERFLHDLQTIADACAAANGTSARNEVEK